MGPEAQIKHQSMDLINPSGADEIIRRIAGGEKDLYSLIIRKYNQRFYRIALSIVNNESDIEDLMQTAYIKAYENLGKFRFDSSFATWITRILINECLMHLKKREQFANTKKEDFFPQSYQKPIVQ